MNKKVQPLNPKVVNPAKRVRIDKSDSQQLQEMESQLGQFYSELGLHNYIHEKKKRAITTRLDMIQNQIKTKLEMLQKKHSIIGPIKNIDYKTGEIVL